MTVAVTFISSLTVVETFTGPFVDPLDATMTVDQLNERMACTASTAVPVTKQAAYEKTLSSGTATIDLTALPGKTSEETVVGTGLKVQFAKFRNKSTNANGITIAKGASNGHTMLGSSYAETLLPGQSVTYSFDEAGPDIASNNKTLDLTGTGSQVLEVEFVLG